MRAATKLGVLSAIAGAALACGDPDDGAPRWATLTDGLDRSALSVTGRDDGAVFVAGGSLGAGNGSLALQIDADGWRELPTGLDDETLWWVWADPVGTDVWFVGEAGVVLRWDGSNMEALDSGTTSTLFGVWGAGPDDVWIVGGDPIADDEDDVVLHWDGATLSRDPTVPARGAALFKVWGASADALFVSGQGGTMLQRTADGWQDRSAELDTVSSVFTVHGCAADEAYAVAGAQLFAFDGAAWSAVDGVSPQGIANGVACGADSVIVVGNASIKLRFDRASEQWLDERGEPPYSDLHGAWVAPGGEIWVVGGNFNLPANLAERTGSIGYRGATPPMPDIAL